MAAPTRVQDSGVVTASGVTSIDLPLTSPAAGNLIVVPANDTLGGRTLSVTDFNGVFDSYSAAVQKTAVSNGKTSYIFNSTTNIGWSGTHNVTVAGNVPGNCNISAVAIEVSGQDPTTPLDVTGSIEETVGVSTHASTDAAINTAVNVFVVTGGQLNVDDRPYAAGSGYTALGDDGSFSFFQYRSSNTALTSELGNWSSSSSLRFNTGVIASYKALSGTKFLLMRP